MRKHLSCSLDELKKTVCYSSEVEINDVIIHYFLIYHENSIFSYINQCPHTGVNLDWQENQFLDNNHQFIQCATHGALFDIKEGLCLRGPCVGDHLKAIENNLENGNIYLIL